MGFFGLFRKEEDVPAGTTYEEEHLLAEECETAPVTLTSVVVEELFQIDSQMIDLMSEKAKIVETYETYLQDTIGESIVLLDELEDFRLHVKGCLEDMAAEKGCLERASVARVEACDEELARLEKRKKQLTSLL